MEDILAPQGADAPRRAPLLPQACVAMSRPLRACARVSVRRGVTAAARSPRAAALVLLAAVLSIASLASALATGVGASPGSAASTSGAALFHARRLLLPAAGSTYTPPYGPAPMPLDPTLPAWPQLKDRHAGEECLYIGNGPSLNKLDWSFLNAAKFPVVMGVNKIYLGFERFKIRINYLACTNRRILTPDQSLTEFSHAIDPQIVKFFRADRWLADDAFNAKHNVVPIRSVSLCNETTCRTAVPHPDGGLDSLGHRKMKYVNDTSVCAAACRTCFCDPSLAYVEGNTVTYASLQVLYYLGCKRVYLVGVDHHFVQSGAENSAQVLQGADPNHFAPEYFANMTWDLADLASSEAHYALARERFAADGREVVDLTVGGKLRIFRRADYKELFKADGGAARNPPKATST